MTILQDPIKAAIWHSLNHYAYADALFLAERLFTEVGSSDALFLLATAYFRAGKPKVVQVLLENYGYISPECKLLYAQSAWELEQYSKVEHIFTTGCDLNMAVHKGRHASKAQGSFSFVINEIQGEYGESACFALSLLGQVFLRTERTEKAEQCFNASLKLNPFLWMPFENMCKAGMKPNPNEVFNVENLKTFAGCCFNPSDEGAPIQHQNTRQKLHSKEMEAENNAPDPPAVLRSKSQNRSYLTEHQQTASQPISVAPSSIFSMKSGIPNPVISKGQSPATFKSTAMHLHGDHLITPPPTKVDFAGVISTSGSLKPLPSSTISQKDTTIETAGNEFLRSTPPLEHCSEWDSSIDSFSGIMNSQRISKTQQRIARGLISGTTTLSPLTPSFGMLPRTDKDRPSLDHGVSSVTPSDTSQHTEIIVPVKKMVTRQSRKPGEQGLNAAGGKLNFSGNAQRLTPSHHTSNTQSSTPANQNNAPVRRSTRIFANYGNSVKENTKMISRAKCIQSKAPLKRNSRTRQTTAKSVRDLSDEISKVDTHLNDKLSNPNTTTTNNTSSQIQMLNLQKSAVEGLMSLLRNIGKGYLFLCQYKCKDAINQLGNLPRHQRNTGWVLSTIGRAHFELAQYREAASIFRELRVLAPYYIQGLEYYSTALWHLQCEVELSMLAYDMKNLDKLCPETWCAVGNCFSLQRDHTSAASFFHRAIQLDPWSSYAYTLLGHELGVTDDLEGGLTCYRNAVRCYPRHYNAWYGIGTIYYKQEKFKIAEIHFRKALSINSQNSVLLCHIGIVQHAQKKTTSALETLNSAVEMDPHNPLCKFHRANILFASEHYKAALYELRVLSEMVPKESLVHFLTGKVYKKMKKNHLAVISFSWAMDLDPKGANNQIKEAIDKQHHPDDEEISDEEIEERSVLETSLDLGPRGVIPHASHQGGLFQASGIGEEFQERPQTNNPASQESDESL